LRLFRGRRLRSGPAGGERGEAAGPPLRAGAGLRPPDGPRGLSRRPDRAAAAERALIARDPAAAAARDYDLIVVGGGIHGAALLLEAARRGFAALLVERGDFGGGTSWNSLRIVHGGLRHLQTGDLRSYYESLGEQRWLRRAFPALVEPLPCLLPLYGRGLRRPPVLRAALLADRLLGARRNRGVRRDRRLSAGSLLDKERTLARCPAVSTRGLRGAALWHDAVLRQPQRVLIEVLRRACECGAAALNYVAATDAIVRDGRIAGLHAEDRLSGEVLELRAPVVVDCAGPWSAELLRGLGARRDTLFRPVVAFNLLLDVPPPCDGALALDGADGGTCLLLGRGGLTLAGTFHVDRTGEPDAVDVERALATLRGALPAFDCGPERVLRVLWGRLPGGRPGSPRPARRPALHDHARSGGPAGLHSLVGVKYTTARAVAARLLHRLAPSHSAREDAAPPAPVSVPDAEALPAFLRDRPAEARNLLARLIDEEAVTSLEDLWLRRTDWGLDPRLPERLGGTLQSLLDRPLPPTSPAERP
jgi:glycerol-3-phosphate dehydrogenase